MPGVNRGGMNCVFVGCPFPQPFVKLVEAFKTVFRNGDAHSHGEGSLVEGFGGNRTAGHAELSIGAHPMGSNVNP